MDTLKTLMMIYFIGCAITTLMVVLTTYIFWEEIKPEERISFVKAFVLSISILVVIAMSYLGIIVMISTFVFLSLVRRMEQNSNDTDITY